MMKRKLWKLLALVLSGIMSFTSVDIIALAEGIEEVIEVEEELSEEISEEFSEKISEEEECSEIDSGEEDLFDEIEEAIGEENDAFSEDDIAHGISNNVIWIIDKDGKLTITGEGDWVTVYSDNYFYYGSSMPLLPWSEYASQIKTSYVDLKNCTKTFYMFAGCSSLTSLDVSNFDTSNVTNMGGMFYGCSSLKSLDLSNFDTSNVTEMQYMFARCSSLMNLDVSNFETSNVRGMGGMFNGCSRLTSLDLSNFDTSNVMNMYYMFSGCKTLTSLDLCNFNTTNVWTMTEMFNECMSLTNLDLSGFNTSNVGDMSMMFNGCSSLTSLDLSNFNTSKAGDNFGALMGCNNLSYIKTPVNVTGSWDLPSGLIGSSYEWYRMDTGEVVLELPQNLDTSIILSRDTAVNDNIYTIFYNLNGGTNNSHNPDRYDIYDVINLQEPSRVGYIFEGWYDYEMNKEITTVSGKNIKVYAKWTINPNDTDIARGTSNYVSWVIDKDEKLTITGEGNWEKTFGALPPWANYSESIKTAYVDVSNCSDAMGMLYNCSNLTSLDLSNFDTTGITRMYSMFYGCSSLTSVDVSNFDTSNVTEMQYMFARCSSLMNLDVSNFDTSNVTTTFYMFVGCSSLTSLDVSNFDTSNVTNMGGMFSGCSSLKSLDLSNFDTSNVEGMGGMFSGCSSLTSLDLSNFDTSNVESMGRMFNGCSSLTSLDLSNFDTSNVWDMGGMFNGCSSLTSLDLSNFDTSNVYEMDDMLSGCSKLKRIKTPIFVMNSCELPSEDENIISVWYRTDTEEVVTELPQNLDKSITLTRDAVVKGETYTITYILNGGTNNENNPATYTGETVITLQNPIKIGYIFEGWYDAETNKKVTTVSDKNIEIYAQWIVDDYDISYNLNGGEFEKTVVIPSTYTIESKDITLPTPTRIGYLFKGWFEDGLFENQVLNNKLLKGSYGDKEFYAKWEVIDYKITYNLNSGEFSQEDEKSKVVSYTIESEDITLPIPTRTGYSFEGWYMDEAFENSVLNNKLLKGSYGDKIFYAKWELQGYIIKYDLNPEVSGDEIFDACVFGVKKKVLSPDEIGFYKNGYMFTGWTADINGKTKVYKAGQDVLNLSTIKNETVVFTAQWKEISYTILFNGNGGKGSVKKVVVKGNNKVVLPDNTFKKKGYTADGWVDSFGRKYADGAEVSNLTTINGNNLTFRANWKENKYRIIFHTNSEIDQIISSDELYYTQKYCVPYAYDINIANPGYVFIGWNTKANGKGKFYAANCEISMLAEDGEISLYAIWSDENTDAVTFIYDAGDGTGYMKPSVMRKNMPLAKATFKKTGYLFAGWRVEESEVTYKNSEILLWDDYKDKAGTVIQLVAQYEPISYTLKINANTGNKKDIPELKTVAYTEMIPVNDTSFTYENHEFLGYNTKANGTGTFYRKGTLMDRLTTKNKGKVTLYVMWEDKTKEANMQNLASMIQSGKLVNFTVDGNTCTNNSNTCVKCQINNIVSKQWFRKDVLGMDPSSTVKTDKLYTKFANRNAYTKGSVAFANFASWYSVSGGNPKTAIKNTMFKNAIVNTTFTEPNWNIEIKDNLKAGDYVVYKGKAYTIYEVKANSIETVTLGTDGVVELITLTPELNGTMITVYRPSK